MQGNHASEEGVLHLVLGWLSPSLPPRSAASIAHLVVLPSRLLGADVADEVVTPSGLMTVAGQAPLGEVGDQILGDVGGGGGVGAGGVVRGDAADAREGRKRRRLEGVG